MVKNKEKKTNKLKNQLLELVLIHAKIKKTDYNGIGECCTCGMRNYRHYMCGGHFMPQSKGLATKFEFDNVNLQCKGCNGQSNQGCQYQHGLYINREYGEGRAEELQRQANTTRKRNDYELDQVIVYIIQSILHIVVMKGDSFKDDFIAYCTKRSDRKGYTKDIISVIEQQKISCNNK